MQDLLLAIHGNLVDLDFSVCNHVETVTVVAL